MHINRRFPPDISHRQGYAYPGRLWAGCDNRQFWDDPRTLFSAHFIKLAAQDANATLNHDNVPSGRASNDGGEDGRYQLGSGESAGGFLETLGEALGGFICLLGALISFLTAAQAADVRRSAAVLCLFLVAVGIWLVIHSAQYSL